MTIRPMERAALISNALQHIESISLEKMDMTSDIPLDVDDLGSGLVTCGFRHHIAGHSVQENRLVVFGKFEMKATIEEEKVLLKVQASLRAVYLLSKDVSEYPEDALRPFAELNGTYNMWPYWRELVQSVAQRVGLSSIVAPVFRVHEHPMLQDATEPKSLPPTTGLPANEKNS